jgi:hypothetical protein
LFVATAEGGEGGLGLGGGGGGGGVGGGGGSAAGHCNKTSSYIQLHCTKLLQHSLFLLAFVLLNFVFFFFSIALSMGFLIPLCSVDPACSRDMIFHLKKYDLWY